MARCKYGKLKNPIGRRRCKKRRAKGGGAKRKCPHGRLKHPTKSGRVCRERRGHSGGRPSVAAQEAAMWRTYRR